MLRLRLSNLAKCVLHHEKHWWVMFLLVLHVLSLFCIWLLYFSHQQPAVTMGKGTFSFYYYFCWLILSIIYLYVWFLYFDTVQFLFSKQFIKPCICSASTSSMICWICQNYIFKLNSRGYILFLPYTFCISMFFGWLSFI